MCERALVTVGYAHETQRTALARILDRMDGLVQMPALSGRIPQIEEDVARVVDVALELEDYVKVTIDSQQVIALKKSGKSAPEICKEMDIHRSSVYRILNEVR